MSLPDSLGNVLAVVVTFNRRETLLRTLDFLGQQDVANVVIVDNASTDGTQEAVRAAHPKLIYHRLNENIGSAGGFGTGMKVAYEAGADWIWLFNDDSRPLPGALGTLARLYKKLPDAADTGFLKIIHELPNGTYPMINWDGVRKNTYLQKEEALHRSDLITFDGCLIRRDVIEAIGYPFAPFFMGIYEFDYCIRAKKAGFKAYNLPLPLIEDEKMGSSGSTGSPPWRTYYNTRNHLYLAIRNRDLRTFTEWAKREVKYVGSIVLRRDRKAERLLFKARAVRDACLNRMGRRYDPSDYH